MKAKKLINQLMKQYYDDANMAKARGEKIGWISGNFPQEIVATMDLCVIYPENHSAMLAMQGKDVRCCEIAEAAGFSSDICSFAKVNIGYCLDESIVDDKIPMPDYLLCCSNVCNQTLKWYQFLERKYQIPLVLIDIPYNVEYDVEDDKLQYIKGQFREAIDRLQEITGHSFDEKKFEKVLRISNENGHLWRSISKLLSESHTILRGMDLFNYMGLIVTQRGRASTTEALQALYNELFEKDNDNKDVGIQKWERRIFYDGMCCWPELMKLTISFERYGMNVTGAINVDMWGLEYSSFDEMIRAYCNLPNAVNLERAKDMRLEKISEKKCDGMIVHMSRSCKMWSGIMYEMLRQIEQEKEIPVLTFDGEQADQRGFSESQFDTRLQGFHELLLENKKE